MKINVSQAYKGFELLFEKINRKFKIDCVIFAVSLTTKNNFFMRYLKASVLAEYLKKSIPKSYRKKYRIRLSAGRKYGRNNSQKSVFISGGGPFINIPIDTKFYIVYRPADPIKKYIESVTFYNSVVTVVIYADMQHSIFVHSLYND
jgi:hypothetical protein